MSDWPPSPENVTVSCSAVVCDVRTVKPCVGIADTRQTPRSPNRTVARPPSDWIECTPAPPCEHARSNSARASREGVGADSGGVLGRGLGLLGLALGVGFALDGDGDGFADRLGEGLDFTGDTGAVGSDLAMGGFGLVEPTTKCTVNTTAVTLTAVQDTHMSR
jgi:hypothetical protein